MSDEIPDEIPKELVAAFERLEELERQRDRIRRFIEGWEKHVNVPTDQPRPTASRKETVQ